MSCGFGSCKACYTSPQRQPPRPGEFSAHATNSQPCLLVAWVLPSQPATVTCLQAGSEGLGVLGPRRAQVVAPWAGWAVPPCCLQGSLKALKPAQHSTAVSPEAMLSIVEEGAIQCCLAACGALCSPQGLLSLAQHMSTNVKVVEKRLLWLPVLPAGTF